MKITQGKLAQYITPMVYQQPSPNRTYLLTTGFGFDGSEHKNLESAMNSVLRQESRHYDEFREAYIDLNRKGTFKWWHSAKRAMQAVYERMYDRAVQPSVIIQPMSDVREIELTNTVLFHKNQTLWVVVHDWNMLERGLHEVKVHSVDFVKHGTNVYTVRYWLRHEPSGSEVQLRDEGGKLSTNYSGWDAFATYEEAAAAMRKSVENVINENENILKGLQ